MKVQLLLLSLLQARVAVSVVPAAGADGLALLQTRVETSTESGELGREEEEGGPPSSEQRLQATMEFARQELAAKEQPGGLATPTDNGKHVRQPMINFGDSQYVSYMMMGKQMIAGIVDTGSFELVVFGSQCLSCSVAAHYNGVFSDTYQHGTLRTQHNYGSGNTLCDESFEEVSMGPYPATKQMFWEVVQAEMPILDNAAFEAIIGVGPPEAPLSGIWGDVQHLIDNVTSYYAQGMLSPEESIQYAERMIEIAIQLGSELPMLHTWSVPIFSICMGGQPGSDGVVVWNDTLAYEQEESFMHIPVMKGVHTWSANMTNVKLVDAGNKTLLGCENGCNALIDSGTSLLAAPTTAVNKIILAMERLNTNCTNLEVLPDLTFQLGEHTLSLPPSAYVARVEGEVPSYVMERMPHLQSTARACQLMIMDMGQLLDGEMWILGVPFFKKYYTTFDLGNSLEQRQFHISEHSEEECTPLPVGMTMARQERKLSLRSIQAKRIHLPERLHSHRTFMRRPN